jgi:hypothetical protein
MEGVVPIVRPALWTAASLGQPEEVRRLLRGGADIEDKGGIRESTPLREAFWNRHTEVARVLLEHGADVSGMNTHGETLLHKAVRGTQNEFVRLLLQHGSVVSVKNNFGNTPLHIAVLVNNTPMVEILLEHGADVSVRNNKGRTPLWGVVKTPELIQDDIYLSKYLQQCHIDVVQLLLNKGADINSKDDLMVTLLMAAAYEGFPRLVQLLLKQGATVTPEDLVSAASGEVRARTFPDFDAFHHKEFRKVAGLLRTALKKRRALHLRAEKTHRAKCIAFAMGHHKRLGAGSIVMKLSPDLLKMIVDWV